MSDIQINGTEYNLELTKEDVLTTIKIGGLTEKFVPNINANKWNDECWLNINHPDVVNAEKETFVDGKIELAVGNNIHRYYEINGKLEYEIDLKEKPPSGRIEFDLDFSEGMKFHKQLSKKARYESNPTGWNKWFDISSFEEYEVLVNQAENVEGGYVLRHNKGHFNQYKTGKFGIIYCPFAIDANDDRIRCELLIVGNKMYIDIDEDWLDKAAYPVKIDPEFGYHTIGEISGPGATDAVLATARDQAPVSGTVTSIFLYSRETDSGQDVKVGIYTDSAGDPNALTSGSPEAFNNCGPWDEEWHEFTPVEIPVTSGAYYWIAANNNQAMTEVWYDDDAPGAFPVDSLSYQSSWNDPFEEDTNYNIEGSFYAEIPSTDLSINISDGIALSESIGPKENLGPVSVSDGMTLAELRSLLMNLPASVSDSLTLSEVLTALTDIKPNVFDTITLGEFVNVLKSVLEVSISDSFSLTELTNLIFSDLEINLSDTINLNEVVTVLKSILEIDVSDGMTLTEYVNVVLESVGAALEIDISDSMTLTESLTLIFSNLMPSVSDPLALSESVVAKLSYILASVIDSIGLNESVSGKMSDLLSSISDGMTFSEFIDVTLETIGDHAINISDGMSLSEQINAIMSTAGISISDTIALTDSATATISGNILISILDSLTLSEAITILMSGLGMSVSDAIGLTENIVMALSINLSVSDSLALTESVEAGIPIAKSVIDYLSLVESVLLSKDIIPSLSETIGLSESLTVSLTTIITIIGKLNVAFTSSKPRIGFTSKKPGVAITGNKPYITFTGE